MSISWSVTRGRAHAGRRGLRRRAAAGAACLALVAAAPAAPPQALATARLEVVARVGAADGPAIEPPQRLAGKVRLGASTRDAIPVPANSSFEIVLPPASERLVFSIGARGIEATDGVRFVVSAANAEGWRPVFSASVGPDAIGWLDHAATLDATGARVERLRFETAAPAGAPSVAEAYWGSVMLLRPSVVPADCPAALSDARCPPNVIVISLDTLGAGHLGAFGNVAGVSPSIDAVLDRSFSFRRAYAHYPNTLVSHASLFTGLYPVHHAVYGGHRYSRLRSQTLAGTLAAHGYVTVGITENAYVSSDFGLDQGFDWYDNGSPDVDESFRGDAPGTFAKAAGWLADHGAQARFFLFVHTYEVHTPYIPRDAQSWRLVEKIDPGYRGRFERVYPGGGVGAELELGHNSGRDPLGDRELTHLRALYAGEIQYLDRLVGEFMADVSSRPMAHRTLVVLTADHGDEFGEHGKIGHGETLYNDVLHVPLAFHWPGQVRAGTSDRPVGLVDVVPTVLDLAGIATPPDLDGRSLAGVLSGVDGGAGERPVFAELRTASGSCRELGLPDACAVERYALQTDRFKFIASLVPRFEALYELATDPGEQRNVAGDFPDEVRRYRAVLGAYAASLPHVTGATAAPVIDDATRERLKALGYVD